MLNSGGSRISQRGASIPEGVCVNPLFGKVFAENYTKMKEIALRTYAYALGMPPGSATAFVPLTTSDVICEHFRAAHPQLVESPEYLWNICTDKYIYMHGIKIVTTWQLDHGQQTLSFFYVVYNYVINLITQTYEHIKMSGGRLISSKTNFHWNIKVTERSFVFSCGR